MEENRYKCIASSGNGSRSRKEWLKETEEGNKQTEINKDKCAYGEQWKTIKKLMRQKKWNSNEVLLRIERNIKLLYAEKPRKVGTRLNRVYSLNIKM